MESLDGVRAERWAGPAAGLLGAVATAVGLIMSDIGGFERVDPDASGRVIADVLAENAARLRTGTTMLMIGLFALTWFSAHLQARLNPTGQTRWEASVASAAGLVTVALMALIVVYVRAALQTTFDDTEVVIAKAIVLLDWDYWRVFAPFISAHLLGAGVALVRVVGLPSVMGWAGVVLALVPLVLPPGLMTIVFLLWLLVLATVLLVHGLRDGRQPLVTEQP